MACCLLDDRCRRTLLLGELGTFDRPTELVLAFKEDSCVSVELLLLEPLEDGAVVENIDNIDGLLPVDRLGRRRPLLSVS